MEQDLSQIKKGKRRRMSKTGGLSGEAEGSKK
jgi:hypothetical protein